MLARTLEAKSFQVNRQELVSFTLNGIEFNNAFRVDLLINECVVVEIKSTERTTSKHEKQLLTYLRLMQLPVGLLLNFGGATLKEGIKRVVNNLDPAAAPLLSVNRRIQKTNTASTDTAPSTAATRHCLDTAARTAAPPVAF